MDYQALAKLLFPDVTETPEELEARFPQRNLPEGAVVTRMAPSPTGFVHLGNLVQGLTSERMAHQSGGVLFLRVEDTDAKREVPGAVEVLINTLKHYGIQFDEGATMEGDNGIYGPYRQRQRASIYHVYAKKLVSEGKAYPCFCTEEELAAMREQQEANKENTGYYGKYAMWRDRSMEDIQAQLDAGATIYWQDTAYQVPPNSGLDQMLHTDQWTSTSASRESRSIRATLRRNVTGIGPETVETPSSSTEPVIDTPSRVISPIVPSS